jgi:hypothetical protein
MDEPFVRYRIRTSQLEGHGTVYVIVENGTDRVLHAVDNAMRAASLMRQLHDVDTVIRTGKLPDRHHPQPQKRHTEARARWIQT